MIDLIRKRFGRLIVIEYTGRYKYLCQCDCGNKKIIYGYSLKNGDTKSCGCLRIEKTRHKSIKHGHTSKGQKSKIYRIWGEMIQRCTNLNDKGYVNYGGRGITVCERWLKSFENFLEDMGKSPEGYQIDRIDNNKGYYKENCRWVTRKEQCRNRRNNHLITINNETKCISEWSEITGIKPHTILMRLRRGWSPKKTFTIPVRKRNK